jgi:general secretion pathway protein I
MGSAASKSCTDRGARRRARGGGGINAGFTLVEVLVAMTIIAIALMASLRATGSLSDGAAELRLRTVAQWSAENRLSQIRVEAEWPDLGRRAFECPQADIALLCQEEVFATPNPQFRRVEVNVYPAVGQRNRAARLVGFATSLP